MRNSIAYFGPQLEDHLPESVVFSVEIFNTLYMVACMQNIYSFWIIGFLMVFDVFFSALAIRTLSKRYKLIRDFQKTQPVKSQGALFGRVLRLVQQPGQLQKQGVQGIRLHAKVTHRIAYTSSEMLVAISKAMEFSETTKQSPPEGSVVKNNLLPSEPSQQVTIGISPTQLVVAVNQRPCVPFRQVMPSGSTCKVAPAPEASLSAMKQRNTEFVSQTFHLLFHCEYLILTEYVE